MPSFIVVNLSNDGYFLPLGTVETEQHLLDFLNGVLDGSIQVGPDFRFTRKMTALFDYFNNINDFVSSVSVGEETAFINASDASFMMPKLH